MRTFAVFNTVVAVLFILAMSFAACVTDEGGFYFWLVYWGALFMWQFELATRPCTSSGV